MIVKEIMVKNTAGLQSKSAAIFIQKQKGRSRRIGSIRKDMWIDSSDKGLEVHYRRTK
jgi:phosphotransferase system HPr-like phosphotransfer protein